MIPQVGLFSFVFWKNLRTPKSHSEINWLTFIVVKFFGFRDTSCNLISSWFLFVFKGQTIPKANYGLLNSPKKLFFGRIEETIICFRDLLTFCSHGFMDPPNIYYHAESTFYNPCWNWRAHFIYIGCNFQAVKEYSFQFPLSVTPDFFFLLEYPLPFHV